MQKAIESVRATDCPVRLHGEGGVYDLYCGQPPGAIETLWLQSLTAEFSSNPN